MRNLRSWLVFPLVSTLSLVFSSIAMCAETGNPNLKSIEAICFSPDGQLVLADGKGAQVVVVETGDKSQVKWTKTEVADIKSAIGSQIGTMADGVDVNKIAVNPTSGRVYLAIRRLSNKQDLVFTVDGAGAIREFPLEKVTYSKFALPAPDASPIVKITDVTWSKDRILVAAQAKETFASKIYSIQPKNQDVKTFSTNTYHVAHGKWETNAPIRVAIPYEEKGKEFLVGAFTCTPIVKYNLEDMTSESRVKGESVIELGNGNTPLDMFVYEKDGKKYILMNTFRMFHKQNPVGPSPYWTAKVDFSILSETEKINESALRRVGKGKASDSQTERAQVVPTFHGVQHMDRLNATQAIVLRNTEKSLNLEVLALP